MRKKKNNKDKLDMNNNEEKEKNIFKRAWKSVFKERKIPWFVKWFFIITSLITSFFELIWEIIVEITEWFFWIPLDILFFLIEKNKDKKNEKKFIEKQKEILNNAIKNVDNYLSFLESKNEKDIDQQINYLYEIKNKINTKQKRLISGEDKEISKNEKLLFRTNSTKDFLYIIKYWNEKGEIDRLWDVQGRNFYLKGANLKGSNLRGSNLIEANLIWANLSNADLKEIKLNQANLSNADLSWSMLENANLSYANLKNADLSWANLKNADLSWVNLENTNLENVIFDFNDFIKNKSYLKMENFLMSKNWESIQLIIFISQLKEERIDQRGWKYFPQGHIYQNDFQYRSLSQEEITEIKNSFNWKQNY